MFDYLTGYLELIYEGYSGSCSDFVRHEVTIALAILRIGDDGFEIGDCFSVCSEVLFESFVSGENALSVGDMGVWNGQWRGISSFDVNFEIG